MSKNTFIASNGEPIKYPDVKCFDENGKPVFKKRLSQRNVLNTRKTVGEKLVFGIVFAIFLVQAISLLFPQLWLFLNSLKDANEYIDPKKMFSLPENWLFSNFADAFTAIKIQTSLGVVGFGEMLFNSVYYTLVSASLSTFLPTLTSYTLSRYKFKGTSFIYTLVIFSMMVPTVGVQAAHLQFLSNIGVLNTRLLPIWGNLAGFGGPFLVYYGFFKTISWSYAEAAQIDGAGPFTVFFRVMLPHAVPMMMTYMIIYSINFWGAYQDVLLTMPSYPTLSSGLFEYKNIAGRSDGGIPVYYAGLIICSIPSVLIFSIFSNKIMGSISVGGLKG